MLRLEFQIQKLSNDFIKASKESESKTEKCESLQIECELLKNELEEKDNELEQRANSEREYKVELCALEQECLRNQEKAENLISNLENKLKMQVERSEIEKEILEKNCEILDKKLSLISDQIRVVTPEFEKNKSALCISTINCEKLQQELLAKIEKFDELDEEYKRFLELNTELGNQHEIRVKNLTNENLRIKQELFDAVRKLNNIEVKKIEDFSRVVKPTSSDLMLNLKKIKALVELFDALVLNTKNRNAKFTKDLSLLKEKPGQTAAVFEVHLKQSNEKYKELIESYVSNVGTAQKYGFEKVEFIKYSVLIEESSIYPISETLYKSISARFSIPLDEVVAGNKLFEDTVKSSNEAFVNLNKLYDGSKTTLHLFKLDLDKLETEISKTTPKVKRLSPLDPEFNEIVLK